MRASLAAALALLALAGPGQADEARDLLERALKAHGGAEPLARIRNLLQTSKGTLVEPGGEVPFTGEISLQLPSRGRWVLDLGVGAQRARIQIVINGERGWRHTQGATRDLNSDDLAQFQDELYMSRLATLAPLRDGSFTLAALPPTRLGDVAAVGLRVSSRGRPDVQIYFDAQTFLLVKSQRKAKAAGVELTKETYYGDFKSFEGVQLPTRIVEYIDGRQSADATVATYRFPARLDDALFGRP